MSNDSGNDDPGSDDPGTPPASGQDAFHALAEQAAADAQQHPRDVGVLLHAAEMFLRAGDPARSVAFARDAVAADPADFRAARTLSGILDAVGDRAEAIQVGKAAALLNPADAEVRLHLGGMLAAERRWRDAAEHLSAHVVSNGATPQGWRLLSTVLHQAGKTELATDAARHAIEADPNNVEFRLNRASLLCALARYTDALDELTTTVAQAPDNALVWRAHSGVHAALGQLAEALRSAERATELAPDDLECREHLTHVAELCGVPTTGTATPGTATWGNPAIWTIGPRRPIASRSPRPGNTLAADIAIRWRVVLALMLRDIRTTFGEMRLGYVWHVLEPITHLVTLGSLFFLMAQHAPAPVGDNIFFFYLTGVVPFLMFTHVSHDIMNSAIGDNAVLQLPIVKRTDVMAALALRQIATELWVGIVIFGIAALLGFQGWPADPLTAAAAVTLLWLLAVGVGACSMVVAHMFPSYGVFFSALCRLLYFGSGIYYSPIQMPDWARDLLWWNPVLQAIDYFRSGFFPQYEPHWLNVDYLSIWVVTSLVIGFAAERTLRAKQMVHA
jgi:ABC-type polysaccharide/polyol phosphate export permease/Tfp pilus assembly protein PilF